MYSSNLLKIRPTPQFITNLSLLLLRPRFTGILWQKPFDPFPFLQKFEGAGGAMERANILRILINQFVPRKRFSRFRIYTIRKRFYDFQRFLNLHL
jgi:hypothetical protein